jgi:hypothetical protein
MVRPAFAHSRALPSLLALICVNADSSLGAVTALT